MEGDQSQLLFLIADYLTRSTPCSNAAAALQAELVEHRLLGSTAEPLVVNGALRPATYDDVRRRFPDVRPDLLRELAQRARSGVEREGSAEEVASIRRVGLLGVAARDCARIGRIHGARSLAGGGAPPPWPRQLSSSPAASSAMTQQPPRLAPPRVAHYMRCRQLGARSTSWRRRIVPAELEFGGARQRLRQTLCGHLGYAVHCAATTPDGRYIVTGADDYLIKVWSSATAALRFTLRGHTAEINDVAIDPSGRIIASVSLDKDVRLWSVASGAPVAIFRHRVAIATAECPAIAGVHTAEVNVVRFSSCGRYLATGADDGSCRLFDLRSIGEMSDELAPFPALAQGAPGNVAQARVPHVALWSTRGDPLPNGAPPSCEVRGVCFTPDGQHVVTATSNGGACMWNCEKSLRISAEAREAQQEALRQSLVEAHDGGDAAAAAQLAAVPLAAVAPDHRFHLNGRAADVVEHCPIVHSAAAVAAAASASSSSSSSSAAAAVAAPCGAPSGTELLFLCFNDGIAHIHRRGTAIDPLIWKRVVLHASKTCADGSAFDWTMHAGCWTIDGRCIVTSQAGTPKASSSSAANRGRAPPPPSKPTRVSLAVWRASDGALLHVLERSRGGVVLVTKPHPMNPHIILCGDEDGNVSICDVARGVVLSKFVNRECGGAGAVVYTETPPYQPTDVLPEACEVYDAAWLENGDGFCATDRNGRLNVYGTGAVSDMSMQATAPIEQYFQSDYKPLERDMMGVVIDSDTRNPPHLDKQLLCNRSFQPYAVQPATADTLLRMPPLAQPAGGGGQGRGSFVGGGGERGAAAESERAAAAEEYVVARRLRVKQAAKQRVRFVERYARSKRLRERRAEANALEESERDRLEEEQLARFTRVVTQRRGGGRGVVLDYASSEDDGEGGGGRSESDDADDYVPEEERRRRQRARRPRRAAAMMTRQRESQMGEGHRLGGNSSNDEEGGDRRSARGRRARQRSAATQPRYADRGSSAADDDEDSENESESEGWSGGGQSSSDDEVQQKRRMRQTRAAASRSRRTFAANAAPRVITCSIDRQWLLADAPPSCIDGYVPQLGDTVAYVPQGHHAWQTSSQRLGGHMLPTEFNSLCHDSPWRHFPCGHGGGGGAAQASWPVVKCSIAALRYSLSEPFTVFGTDVTAQKKSVVLLVTLQVEGVSRGSSTTGRQRFTLPRLTSAEVRSDHPFAPLTRDGKLQFNVLYYNQDANADFLVLWERFEASLQRLWSPGELCEVPYAKASTAGVGGVAAASAGTSRESNGEVEEDEGEEEQEEDEIEWYSATVNRVIAHPITEETLTAQQHAMYAQSTWEKSPWETVEVQWDAPTEGGGSQPVAYLNPWDLRSKTAASSSSSSSSSAAVDADADAEEDGLRDEVENARAAWGAASVGTSLSEAKRTRIFDVIEDLMEMPCADDFNEAVALDNEKIAPGYSAQIPVPMHLKLIRNRIQAGYYRTVDAVCSDVKLIVANCVSYNRLDAMISRRAHEMCAEAMKQLQPGIAYVAEASTALILINEASSYAPDSARVGGGGSSSRRGRARGVSAGGGASAISNTRGGGARRRKGKGAAKKGAAKRTSRRRVQTSDSSEEEEEEEDPKTARNLSAAKRALAAATRSLCKLDPDQWFASEVNADDFPDYYEIIARPMNFNAVRAKINNLKSRDDVRHIAEDLITISTNAIQYNLPNSTVYNAACKLLRATLTELQELGATLTYDFTKLLADGSAAADAAEAADDDEVSAAAHAAPTRKRRGKVNAKAKSGSTRAAKRGRASAKSTSRRGASQSRSKRSRASASAAAEVGGDDEDEDEDEEKAVDEEEESEESEEAYNDDDEEEEDSDDDDDDDAYGEESDDDAAATTRGRRRGAKRKASSSATRSGTRRSTRKR